MRRYLGAPWLFQWYPNVTLKVHNKNKILVSKKERCHVSMSGYCSVYRSNSIFRSDPYFSLASLYNVKYSVMLWSDNRNILDYWIFVARYCFKHDL